MHSGRNFIKLIFSLVFSLQCIFLSAEKSLPSGYAQIKLGMTVDEVKSLLLKDSQFGYRGDRDVSLLPRTEQTLIETDASRASGSFLDRCWFQFHDGRLYIITISLNPKKIDHYSIFSTLCTKYGNPDKMNPEKSEWKSSSVIMTLEKPLTMKYTDAVVQKKILEGIRVEKSTDETTRQRFLDGL